MKKKKLEKLINQLNEKIGYIEINKNKDIEKLLNFIRELEKRIDLNEENQKWYNTEVNNLINFKLNIQEKIESLGNKITIIDHNLGGIDRDLEVLFNADDCGNIRIIKE